MMIPSESSPALAQEEEVSIDLRQYIALFLQWWWLVLLAGLLAGGAAYLISRQMTPIYQSSTTLLINEAPSNRTADYTSLMTSERLAQTYAQMITKRPVLERVIYRLKLPYTADELAKMVSASPVRDTQLLTITVESPNPSLSPAVANALVVVFTEQLQETQSSRFQASKDNLQKQITDAETQIANARDALENATDPSEISRWEARLNQYEQIYANLVLSYEQIRTTEAQSFSNVVQIETAVPEFTPVKPKVIQNTLLAAVVGMMLAAGGVIAFDMLDDRVKNPEDIRRQLNLPVMGAIVRYDEPEDGRLITQAQPRSPVAESFRALRTNVQYASVDDPIRTLLVTSPTPADGKTTVASNLAMVTAQGGKQVTVLDADMHRPRLHYAFHTDLQPGLSSLFVQRGLHLNGDLRATPLETLHVISAGKMPPNPSELLGSQKMREIIAAILERSEMLIIDTPPVLSVTDAVVLAPVVDGVLLVVRPGHTRMSALKQSVEQLRYVGARVIGVVVNAVDTKKTRYNYYYKSYYYKAGGYYGKENGKRGVEKRVKVKAGR